jgi:cysteine desulfurase/selenocysteine lyase
VARLIHAPSESSVVFTRGTTESINLVAHGWGRKFLQPGDEIVLSEMEHHSNLIPWQLLARDREAKLRFVPVAEDGTLDQQAYLELLGPRTRLVALTHVSNVLGTVNPIRGLAEAAHAHGALFLVDAAQSVPHLPVDFQELQVDFLAFSGHKMCGPTGAGVLVADPERLDEMDPFMGGGEMILKVHLERAEWAEPPHRFEAGTPNIAGVVGLGAAIDYLERIGLEAVHAYEQDLAGYAWERLTGIPGLSMYGRAPERSGVFAFDLEGVHPHDVSQFVDREGVAIRAGHHCAQPLMRKFGVPSTGRASIYFYNTREDIDRLADALVNVKEFFARES